MTQYNEPEEIVADSWRFKEKLGIGEEAYRFLKIRKNLATVVGAAGASAGGALVVSSSTVATTFFPASGFLATLGLGAAATTPIGWVIGAGVLAGGAYFGAKKFLSSEKDDRRMIRIPRYITTPLDLIANELLGLMLPLGLKIAKADDNEITKLERNSISDYYAEEWGYSRVFVDRAIKTTENLMANKSYRELSKSLVEYCDQNPDCNQKAIVQFLITHLDEFIEAEENSVHKERKFLALEHLKQQFS